MALERRQRDVKEMNAIGDELVQKLDEFNGQSAEAQREKRTTNDRYERVRQELMNQERLIDAQLNAADKFNKALQSIELEISRVDSALLDDPVGNDPDVLKRQLNELKVRELIPVFILSLVGP